VFTYVVKRLFAALFTLWVIVTVTFFLMHAIPGNPFAKEGNMPKEVLNNLLHHYHLNEPLAVQYMMYLKSLAHFDFGPSLKSNVYTVNEMIRQGFPVSLQLGLNALTIALIGGIFTGVIAAIYHQRWPDKFILLMTTAGISVPSFILAMVLIHFVAVQWDLLPAATWGSWRHAVLPSLALSVMPLAFIARLLRSSMLDVLQAEYIKTAKAKGLAPSLVIMRHALRQALLPTVTSLGVIAANLVTGSFIIEHIFAIPGLGDLFVKSIFARDYPAILGATVFYSMIFIILTFLVDLVYTVLDPRINLREG
jgi:ABC-type dipeptide/oligopeptide/nickel transport system permease component